MRVGDLLPFHGHIVWLTPEQGGRRSGPPLTPEGHDYAATGYVPPATVESGLRSVVVRVADRAAWRSSADATWLVPIDDPPHHVGAGDIIVITEGPRTVAYFHVESIDEFGTN